MNHTSFTKDLTTGNIARQLLGFIGPLFLSNVLQTLYNVVDMSVVGHFVGSIGLSAVSVCSEVIVILTFTALGFSGAGQVLISQYTGAKQPERTRKLIGCLFTFMFLIALGFTFFALIFYDGILKFANIPNAAQRDGAIYLKTCAVGLVFTYGYNIVSAILRGMGDSRHPFIFVAAASVLNIVLDLLFVVGFSLGTFGAALATVIAQGLSFLISIVFLYRNRDRFGFDFRLPSFRMECSSLKWLLALGLPMSFQYGMIQAAKLLVVRWINEYGVIASAVTGIGSKFNSIGMTFAMAVGTSASTMIGQCIGAKKYDRVRNTILVSSALSIGTAAVLSVLVAIFPRAVFGIFTSDSDVLAMAGSYMPVIVVMLFSSAFRAPMNGLINGSGHSGMNLLLAFVDGVVSHIGLTVLCGFVLGYGIWGLWYGNAAAGFTPFFVGLIFYYSGRWKQRPL